MDSPLDATAHAELVHECADDLGRAQGRRVGDRVELRVLDDLAAAALEQLAKRRIGARDQRALDAEGLVDLDREDGRRRVVKEEVVDREDVLRGEVVLGLETLAHRARLRVVLIEVE